MTKPPSRGRRRQRASSQLHRREDLRRTRDADAVQLTQVVDADARQAAGPARSIQDGRGQFERVGAAAAVSEDRGNQLVVAEAGGAEPYSFSRGRSDSDNRIYFCAMSRFRWYVLLGPALLAIVSLVACGEPPDKEMHQAQGAIDAARAAGAETYAPDEFKAAVDALTRAQDAVAQRDYRLALNNALDSRERAQNAAKMAADGKAAARSAAERLLADVTSAIAVSAARLQAAEAARAPKTATDPLKEGLAKRASGYRGCGQGACQPGLSGGEGAAGRDRRVAFRTAATTSQDGRGGSGQVAEAPALAAVRSYCNLRSTRTYADCGDGRTEVRYDEVGLP